MLKRKFVIHNKCFIVIFFLIISNLILLFKFKVIKNELTEANLDFNIQKEILNKILSNNTRFIGEKFPVSLIDLKATDLTPILYVRIDNCSVCIDNLIFEVEGILKNYLLRCNLFIVIITENKELGRIYNEIFKLKFKTVYSFTHAEINLNKINELPNIFFTMVNNENEIVQFNEYSPSFPELFLNGLLPILKHHD